MTENAQRCAATFPLGETAYPCDLPAFHDGDHINSDGFLNLRWADRLYLLPLRLDAPEEGLEPPC